MTMQYRPISLLRKIVRDDMVASPAGCTNRFVLGQLIPAAPATNTRCSCQRAQSTMWDMSRIRPQCLDADCSDRSARSDVLLREEPDKEEDDEEDKGNVTDDEGDDDEEDDEGYSVRAFPVCQW